MPVHFPQTLPLRRDSRWTLTAKILQVLNLGGVGASAYYEGVGNPNGVLSATAGATYRDTATDVRYTSVGNNTGPNSVGTVWI